MLPSVAISRSWNPSVCRSFIIRINNTPPLLLQMSTSFNTFTECLLGAALAGYEGVGAVSWPLPSWDYGL